MRRRDFLTAPVNKSAQDDLSWARYYTNAVLTPHAGGKVRFYDDLIRGKIALVNFLYTSCQGICPGVTANLARVQRGLSGRIGRDTFIYSITLKPEEDDPIALRHYADLHGVVAPGWLLLTGDSDEIETIRYRLFGWNSPDLDRDIEQHTGMLHLVNDSIKRTSGVPALASDRQILQYVSWLDPVSTRSRSR
jgi:protein SCO1/2